MIHNTCNVAICDLPGMYACGLKATGPRAEGIHIRQIPHAHVTTITCITLCGQIKGPSRETFDPKVLLFQPIMHCHSHSLGFIYKVLTEYSR